MKTHYPGDVDSLKKIVETSMVPVIIAGGPATRSESQLFQMVEDCMEAGAVGIALGRSFFQSESPEKIMKKVHQIVFG